MFLCCLMCVFLCQGGEIGININWKCNLDYNVTHCNPKYFFTRLDAAFKNSVAAKGYNFR